jgi:hypothetical protein
MPAFSLFNSVAAACHHSQTYSFLYYYFLGDSPSRFFEIITVLTESPKKDPNQVCVLLYVIISLKQTNKKNKKKTLLLNIGGPR